MELKDRIADIIQYSKLSIPKFSQKVGFKTPQTIRSLLNGSTKNLTEIVRYKIERAYPEINMHWLIAGVGSMLSPQIEGRTIILEYNEDGRCFHVNVGNTPENQNGYKTVCKTTNKKWYKFRKYLNEYLTESISNNDRLSLKDPLSYRDILMYWNNFMSTDDYTDGTNELEESNIQKSIQLPKTSTDPAISELLDIIKSQQETIKTLTDTLSKQAETINEVIVQNNK